MRKMISYSRYGTLFIAVVLCTVLCAAPSVKESIVLYFRTLLKAPQEKVYLQIDRSVYGAGEDIWFKGYLVNAVTHREQDAFSKFIMVELVNRKDSIVLSKKVKGENGRFSGNLKLDARLPEGDYYLRSYTNWMRNEDPDFFYSRLLRISNSINTELTSGAYFEPFGPEKLRAMIAFRLNGKLIGRKVKLSYAIYANDKRVEYGLTSTDETGRLVLDMNYKPSMKDPRIELSFVEDKYDYKTTFYPYLKSTDYHVTFFPEGGDLLAAPKQIVAFKAQGANGYSLPVEGKVLDAAGNEVATLTTLCDGMGSFSLSARKGEKYYAEVTSADGVKKRFDLPAVKPSGVKLTALRTYEGIRYNVLKDEDTAWPDTLYVAAHIRGILRYLQVINAERSADLIPVEYLSDGVIQLILLSKNGKALSERLVFVKRPQQPELDLSADRSSYKARDLVKLSLSSKDAKGMPLQGDFGVSVIHKDMLSANPLEGTIQSNLWLTSDLKGFVENPGRYFEEDNEDAPEQLDLLMLTHGWRRFKTNDFTQLPDTSFTYHVDQGFSFTGRIRTTLKKPAGMGVVAMAREAGKHYYVTTDEKGKFMFEGEALPDSTWFIVRSQSKNRLPIEVMVDSLDETPLCINKYPYPDGKDVSSAMTAEALNVARDRYFAEGGMQLYNLRELTITADKYGARTSDKNMLYNKLADRVIDPRQFEGYEDLSALDMLLRIPGVPISEEAAYDPTASKPLLIINDVLYGTGGMPADYQLLLGTYKGSDVQSLSYVKHNQAALVSLGGNQAIIFIMKPIDLSKKKDPTMAFISPRGYNQSVEFYSPVYETPQQKANSNSDLRTTLYWDPHVMVDSEGHVSIEYYTDDKSGDHQIIVEGISADGRPMRVEQTITVE